MTQEQQEKLIKAKNRLEKNRRLWWAWGLAGMVFGALEMGIIAWLGIKKVTLPNFIAILATGFLAGSVLARWSTKAALRHIEQQTKQKQ